MTLVELIITVAIVATLVALGVPAYTGYRERARIVQAIANIRTLEKDILLEEAYRQRLPNSLDDIGRGGFMDPWNYPYQYLSKNSSKWNADRRRDRSDNPLNDDFDLYSVGQDGQTKPQLKYNESQDDVVRARQGEYVGLAADY